MYFIYNVHYLYIKCIMYRIDHCVAGYMTRYLPWEKLSPKHQELQGKLLYCSPEGSKGAVQHDAINWVASKLSQRKIVATSGETLPAIVTDMK